MEWITDTSILRLWPTPVHTNRTVFIAQYSLRLSVAACKAWPLRPVQFNFLKKYIMVGARRPYGLAASSRLGQGGGSRFLLYFCGCPQKYSKNRLPPLVCFCKHLAILPSPAPSVQTSFVYVFTPLPDLAWPVRDDGVLCAVVLCQVRRVSWAPHWPDSASDTATSRPNSRHSPGELNGYQTRILLRPYEAIIARISPSFGLQRMLLAALVQN